MISRAAGLLFGLAACGDAVERAIGREAARQGIPGAAVVVSGETSGTWTVGAFEPDDRVRLSSLTKTFTAVVVVGLADEGVWSLEDPVSSWVDGVPGGDDIRLRHLLSHTSGLGDYTDADVWTSDRPWTVDELLALTWTLPREEPGAAWVYSSSGYLLLGRALERATGQTWDALVAERVAGPLDLAVAPGGVLAPGYAPAGDGLVEVTGHAPAEDMAAAGALSGSAQDLAVFSEALFAGRLLADGALASMTAPAVLADGTPWRYGLGLGVDGSPDGPSYGHRGRTPGYASSWSHRPDLGLTVAVVTDHSEADARRLERAVWVILSR